MMRALRLALAALLAGALVTHALAQAYPVKPVRLFVPFPPSGGNDIVAQARAKSGELNYVSSGNGPSSHLSGEFLQALAGIRLIHVPYKGTAPAITDVMDGQVPMMFSVIPTALPQPPLAHCLQYRHSGPSP